MLLKLFGFVFSKIIGDLPEGKKEAAWDKFSELLAIIVEKGAEGAVKGAKS